MLFALLNSTLCFISCYGLLKYPIMSCSVSWNYLFSDFTSASFALQNESGYFHLVISSYCCKKQVTYFLFVFDPCVALDVMIQQYLTLAAGPDF